jgi:hypothetical protein
VSLNTKRSITPKAASLRFITPAQAQLAAALRPVPSTVTRAAPTTRQLPTRPITLWTSERCAA